MTCAGESKSFAIFIRNFVPNKSQRCTETVSFDSPYPHTIKTEKPPLQDGGFSVSAGRENRKTELIPSQAGEFASRGRRNSRAPASELSVTDSPYPHPKKKHLTKNISMII